VIEPGCLACCTSAWLVGCGRIVEDVQKNSKVVHSTTPDPLTHNDYTSHHTPGATEHKDMEVTWDIYALEDGTSIDFLLNGNNCSESGKHGTCTVPRATILETKFTLGLARPLTNLSHIDAKTDVYVGTEPHRWLFNCAACGKVCTTRFHSLEAELTPMVTPAACPVPPDTRYDMSLGTLDLHNMFEWIEAFSCCINEVIKEAIIVPRVGIDKRRHTFSCSLRSCGERPNRSWSSRSKLISERRPAPADVALAMRGSVGC